MVAKTGLDVTMYKDTLPLNQAKASHLNFNLVESLAIVHSNHGPHHLRQDDHVPQMGLHHLWFLHGGRLFLCLAQALQEGLLLAAKATVQPPPLAGAVKLHQLLTVEGEMTVLSMKALTTSKIKFKLRGGSSPSNALTANNISTLPTSPQRINTREIKM